MSVASTQVQLSQAQIMAIYNNRFTYARRNTRRVKGRAFSYGNAYTSGVASDPLRITTGNFLAGVRVHIHGTVTYTQAATTAAPTLTDAAGLGLISNLAIIGEEEVTPVSLSAWAQEIFRIMAEKADYVSAAVFNLPLANTGSTTVTNTETVDQWIEFPMVQDFIDLLGIQNLNNNDINVNVQINWGNFSAAVTLPTGVTATQALVADLYAIRYRANKQGTPGPDFSKFYNALAITRNRALNAETFDITVNYKQWITGIQLHVFTASGVLDVNNSLGISSIKVTATAGEVVLLDQDLQDIQNENLERYGPPFAAKYQNKGVYILDFPLIRDYIEGARYTDLTITLTMSATPPAGAQVSAYLQGLANTFPAVPLFI